GSTTLSAPAGTASSSSQLRLKYPNTRSKLPSLLRIHPSKYGTTSWPLLNFVEGSSVGSCPARSTRARSDLIMRPGSRGRALLVLRVVDVEDTHPREAHLVDRALAVADPVARVRVVLVRRRVVVPRGDVDDRPR